MKRIFFFDIDNTLLDHRTLTIPRSALSAIAALPVPVAAPPTAAGDEAAMAPGAGTH